MLIVLQYNILRISLNKKRKRNLLSRKQINLKLSKKYKNYLKIQI